MMSQTTMHTMRTGLTASSSCLFVVVINALLLTAYEEPPVEDVSAVFDDDFLEHLDESLFSYDDSDLIWSPESEGESRKRRWDSDFSEDDSYAVYSFDPHSDESFVEDAEPISPAYDIERASLSPEKKRRRISPEQPDHAADAQPTFSRLHASSGDSWGAMAPREDAPPAASPPLSDSWDMSPIKADPSDTSLPFTLAPGNPIGHVLSSGVQTTKANKASQSYACRACGKDLKSHQHTPTMHFMLPKHERCWSAIAQGAGLSRSTSKSLYPPQFIAKTDKKNVYTCSKCGLSGSKRKILSHVMGAKCGALRDEYSRILAWDGIRDEADVQ